MTKIKSGKYWVMWANIHAKNSNKLDDLADPFKSNVKAFIAALEAAGADVEVTTTLRHPKRAYLFHWCWLIALGKKKPSEASPMTGVDIEWDHGDADQSKAGALEMVKGFGLAVPPKSTVAPAVSSNHIRGQAIDMNITWTGVLNVKNKAGNIVPIPFMQDPNANVKLHQLGETYFVKKLKTDAPHWSVDGK